jgi:hypothetical protein
VQLGGKLGAKHRLEGQLFIMPYGNINKSGPARRLPADRSDGKAMDVYLTMTVITIPAGRDILLCAMIGVLVLTPSPFRTLP